MSKKNVTPQWKKIKTQATEAVLFVDYIYNYDKRKLEEISKQIPNGYELFLNTYHLNDTKKHSFKCAVFVNQKEKKIVFATAGTQIGLNKKGKDDIIDDLLLTLNKLPKKIRSGKVLNDMILDSLQGSVEDYKFFFTGHSLGAAVMEMLAVDLHIKLIKKNIKVKSKQITCITLENPGTKKILNKMYRDAGISNNKLEEIALYSINNNDNIINTLHPQAGETLKLKSQIKRKYLDNFLIRIIKKILPMTASFIKKVIMLIKDVFTGFRSHKMKSIKSHILTHSM